LTPTPSPAGVDPITHFLRTGHAAHCEYFASATVLLLRSAGVPARYVTGYVADEYNDETLVWLARNRDAHAWAEAYDDGTRQWFPVESTPGRSYSTVQSQLQSQQAEGFFDVFRGSDDEESETLLSRAAGWLLSMRATDPLLLLFRLAQLPLFCVLVFLLWSKYLKPTAAGNDLIDQQSLTMLRKVDRRLRGQALVRMPGETLYQFADRIDASQADSARPLREEARKQLAEISRWYREYADARYQGKLPRPLEHFSTGRRQSDHRVAV
jgi:hypothetical protein